jgi:molybdate transport system substrate-binding protein
MSDPRPCSRRTLLALLTCSALFAGCSNGTCTDGSSRSELVIFAAMGLRDVTQELGATFASAHSVEPVYNFAASNVLAQQIAASPQADVYLSANEACMDLLEEQGRLAAGSRRPFLGNRIVLIAHRESALEIAHPRELAKAAYRYLAIGEPQAVPVGRYARLYLEGLELDGGSVWDALAGRIAPEPNVRAVLAQVEADPEILGFVYATDARLSDRVRVLYDVAPEEGPEVRFFAAAIAGRPREELARAFLDWLHGPEAAAICRRFGFGTLEASRD